MRFASLLPCCVFVLVLIANQATAISNATTVTQLLEKGGTSSEIQAFLKVGPLPHAVDGAEDIESYAGYFTVNERYDSNIFAWYFPAQDQNKSAPLLIWFQGGPGSSGMIGLFTEMGPFQIQGPKIVPNFKSWNIDFGMIFLDQPVGTGLSYTTQDAGYAANETQVAADVWNVMQQFYAVFPDQARVPLFLTGESYAGKYVPACAYHIMQANQFITNKMLLGVNIPLEGIAIGDGLVDPGMMMYAKSSQSYAIGLINSKQRKVVDAMIDQTIQFINQKRWLDALKVRSDVNDYINTAAAGGVNPYDYRSYTPYNFSVIGDYLNRPEVLAALHVAPHQWHDHSDPVYDHLTSDIMQSTKELFGPLLAHYRVLLYQGQFDLQDGIPASQAWIDTISWSGSAGYLDANRTIWTFGGKVAGYAQSYSTLTELSVIGAGHLVPMDQPATSLDMIRRFVNNVPFADVIPSNLTVPLRTTRPLDV